MEDAEYRVKDESRDTCMLILRVLSLGVPRRKPFMTQPEHACVPSNQQHLHLCTMRNTILSWILLHDDSDSPSYPTIPLSFTPRKKTPKPHAPIIHPPQRKKKKEASDMPDLSPPRVPARDHQAGLSCQT